MPSKYTSAPPFPSTGSPGHEVVSVKFSKILMGRLTVSVPAGVARRKSASAERRGTVNPGYRYVDFEPLAKRLPC